MARQKRVTASTAFAAAVRAALEHVAEPEWLTANSPLASPYFLGAGPEARGAAAERGQRLRQALHDAADALWGGPPPDSRQALGDAVDADRAVHGSKSARYHYLLLDLRYLRRHYPPSTFPTAVEAMAGFVNVSPTRFFVHLEEAIDDLGQRLLARLNPSLRLERPALAMPPLGREVTLDALRGALLAGRSAAVTGPGGVGKSTLGAALVAAWPSDAVFWHTFRPGLNDDLNSVLFSLGHFVHQAGAPTLWAQLMAGAGSVGPLSQALGMLRMDLEALGGRQPLLCFDEVDMLQTSAGDPRRKQHVQVLELLESLRGLVPLLLIGQRVYVDTDDLFPLEPLPPAESQALLQRLGAEPDGATLQRIRRVTGGNPRLLELCAAVWRAGEGCIDLDDLPSESWGQPLFSRLWRRLDEDQRALLSALSVYRSYAPASLWTGHDAAVADLTDRGLIKPDLAGGLSLLPFFRQLIYDVLPDESRRVFHHDAALARAQFADYTAAAHHFCQAGEPEQAVQVWFDHQDQEVLAGQASAAGEVFEGIEVEALSRTRRKQLRVIRNRLALLAGEAEHVLEGMERFVWDAEDETTAEALGQWAYAYELRDQTDRALVKYDEAIAMLSRVATRVAAWHLRRGLVYWRETDAEGMRREADLAMYDVERLRGMIDYMTGDFEPAAGHIQASLQIAEAAADREKIARAHQMLALIAGRQGQLESAEAHAQTAMGYFRDVGDRLQLEGMRAELAGMYLNVRQFEAVIEPAERALAFFERIGHEAWISTINTNLAEAYLETGELEKARACVFKVLRMESPRSQPYALYTLGHVYGREGNVENAVVSFREGIEVARRNEDRFIEAYLLRSLGTVYQGAERTAEAAEALREAVALFTGMGLQDEVAQTEGLLVAAD